MDEGTERRDPVAQTDDAAGVNGASAKTSGETSDTSDTSDTSGTTESTRQPSKESTETLPPMARFARQQLPRLAPWAGAVLALVLIGMVAMLFADTRTIDAAVRPTPTATPAPTATAAPTMTPTAIDGFQFYRDPSNHYVIQYPLGWIVSTDNASQGIEFCDDCQNPGYIVQVNTPSNLGDVGPPPSQNSASGWVTYALNGLSSRLQSGTLTVLGEQQAITIGGVVWQSGGALVTDPSGSASFRVQVYATVYEGKPYILVLSTTEDRFTAGTIQFFGPMLQSFQFVKQPQP